MRIRYLLKHPEIIETMGVHARQLVLDNYLITRQLREYLTLVVDLSFGTKEQIELSLPSF